jgi:hypothetical protein
MTSPSECVAPRFCFERLNTSLVVQCSHFMLVEPKPDFKWITELFDKSSRNLRKKDETS